MRAHLCDATGIVHRVGHHNRAREAVITRCLRMFHANPERLVDAPATCLWCVAGVAFHVYD